MNRALMGRELGRESGPVSSPKINHLGCVSSPAKNIESGFNGPRNSARERREKYLRETGRTRLLVAEGFIRWEIIPGGRDPYTPMAELDALIADIPDVHDPVDPLEPEPAEPTRCRAIDKSRVAEIVKLRKSGMKCSDIAAKFMMPMSSVRGVVQRAGLSKSWRRA